MKQTTINGWRRVQARTAARLLKAGRCDVVEDRSGARVLYFIPCDVVLAARPANHAPAEKSALAARINQWYKHQGHEAPIDYERVPGIPRRLLRALWAEIREQQANAWIEQAANSVIM